MQIFLKIRQPVLYNDGMVKKWTFDNDELFDLVMRGKKRGTCCLYDRGIGTAKIGEINIIYNSKKQQAKIRITSVRICRFCDVDETWAQTEGEGDLSLKYWQQVHREFFKNIKPDFNDADVLELNEFVVC